jgi:hypothetical protein
VTGEVFISYRSEDSSDYALLLHAELSRRFGPDLIFLDYVSIPAGGNYVAELLNRVRRARVLLAVIGPHWLTATDQPDRRRIDDKRDWVRRELVMAFDAGVIVIPVLTDGAQLPPLAELPVDIADLASRQYRRLRRRDASTDLARICNDLAAADPGLAAAAQLRSGATQPADPVSTQALTTPPAQLPADTAHFTGRVDELAELVALRRPDSPDVSRAGIGDVYSIDGMAGIGKTALAIHAGHQLAPLFRDGCLFLDLHGHGDGVARVEPASALARMLLSLGVPGEQVPTAARWPTRRGQ